jgi:hypothetical protein
LPLLAKAEATSCGSCQLNAQSMEEMQTMVAPRSNVSYLEDAGVARVACPKRLTAVSPPINAISRVATLMAAK